MSFLYPSLIAGPLLLVIGLPLLIHMINVLRHRRIEWAAMQFLVQSQRKHRRWILLKQLLLLLLRTAALGLLLCMLAQPVVRNEWGRLLGGVKTHHLVLLDDSYSMSDRRRDGSVFDEAKRFIQQLADRSVDAAGEHRLSLLRFSRARGSDTGSRFDLLKDPIDRSLCDRLDGILAVLESSQTAAGPAAALDAIGQLPDPPQDEAWHLYIVSDFRANPWHNAAAIRTRLDRIHRRGGQIHLLRCAEQMRDNLALSVFQPAGGTAVAGVEMLVNVSVHNFGTAAARQVAVQLAEDGQSRPAVVLDQIAPGGVATGVFRAKFLAAGQHTLTATLRSDAVAADNTRYLALDLPETAPVLIIDASREGRDAQYVVAALAPGGAAVTGLTPRVEGPSFLRNHARLDDFTAIYLLNLERLDESEIEALERYARDGGGVAFFLGQRSTGQFFTSRLYRNGAGLFPLPLSVPTDLLVDRLEKTPDLVISDHPIFEIFAGERNSFLNSVLIQRYFAVSDAWKPDPESSTRVIARLRNGAPLVVEKRLGEGRVVAFLTPAAPGTAARGRWNNWGRNNPSFVVVMLELQAYLAQRRDAAQYLVGQRLVIPLDPKQYEPQVRFQVPDGDTTRAVQVDAVPQASGVPIAVLNDTGTSGIYETELRRRDRTLQRRFCAYNVVAAEGNLELADDELLAAQLDGVPFLLHHAANLQDEADAQQGFNLSSGLLLLVIALLVVEQLVAYSASYHYPSEGAGR
jgi:hypothetical protein